MKTSAPSPAEAKALPVVAWIVSVYDMTAYTFATTKAKAQWICVRAYWDAYDRRKGTWPRAEAKRYPLFDNHPYRDDEKKAYAYDQLL